MNDFLNKAENLSQNEISEKVNFWMEVCSSTSDFKILCEVYDILYKNDPLGIAWRPEKAIIKNTNLTRVMEKRGKGSYEEFFHWAEEEREAYWKDVITELGIRFSTPYDSVLEGDPAGPVWFRNGKLNISDSCFLAEPGKTAIVQKSEDGGERQISYGELDRLSSAIASGLSKKFEPGASIVIYMPLTIDSVAAYLGVVKAGMRVVSVADSFSASELENRCKIIDAAAVISCDGYIYGGKYLDIYSKVRQAAVPEAFVLNYVKQPELRPSDSSFEDLLGDPDFTSVKVDPGEVSNILFSSGTTKEPKAIPWTHITPVKSAADAFFHHDVHPEDVVTWTTGMGWMMAPWLIYAALINKATMALYFGAPTTDDYAKFVQDAGITMLGTIPSVVKAWRKAGIYGKYDWKVRVFSSTGEPSNTDDYFFLMALARFRAPVIEYCGGTEIGGGYITGTLLHYASPSTFTTPALGLNFYLLNSEQGFVDEAGAGEVYLVPPSVGLSQKLLNRDNYQEYYQDAPDGPEGEQLRRHGDAFEKISFAGQVFYKSAGRTDDAMNLGGVKVSAVEIEEVINTHPAVAESAAITVAEEQGPGQLVVFVVLNDDADTGELKAAFKKMIASELNPLFKVADVVKVQELPRTTSGKVMRRTLRKRYQRG